jgi:nucleoside-diphosphate-sugar epimerase
MPYQEDQNTDRPLSPYAATKKAAEALAHSYHFLYGLDLTVLRFFTVYGPACRPDMAPLRFVQRILEKQPITLYGDGSQSRDFTYCADIAEGAVASLDLNPDRTARRAATYRTINLGSDHPVKVSEFIAIIERLTGEKAIIHRKPGHPADMFATWADIHRAQELLKWKPRTTLEEGLTALIAWYQENRSWASKIKTD